MIKLYGIPNCDSCRNALKWFKAKGMSIELINLRETMPGKTQLKKLQKLAGWESLINKRSATWRKIPEFDRQNTDAKSAIELMLSYPTVIKRPILELEDQVMLGFDNDTYESLKLK
ncbi:MAG: Spx/MgsR family RNA polymerase-binding regulatory protein [Gammaproteobacteria bacterium]|nr:Spx/MgsR family RNA polymerase-binding regulatory protein [Gammaproteobacteria bacterium]